MITALRRIGIILAYMIPVYLILTTGLTMIVNPRPGTVEITASQQAAFDRQALADAEHAFNASVVTFNAAHHCEAVSDWQRHHPHAIPARMVQHLDGSGVLGVVPWVYPAKRGYWVVGLC